jgi:hypothetical protein
VTNDKVARPQRSYEVHTAGTYLFDRTAFITNFLPTLSWICASWILIFTLREMATSLTIHGDLSYGLLNPRLSLYSNPGLKWSAQELKEVRALRADRDRTSGSKPDIFCKLCERLHEEQEFETFIHHPGYRALSASASNCSLCHLLLLSLDKAIPSWISDDDRTQNTEEPPLTEVEDRIELTSLPQTSTTKYAQLRFIVQWKSLGFQWSGEIVGIYRQKIEGWHISLLRVLADTFILDELAPAIWTSSNGGDFNARLPVIDKWIGDCQKYHQRCSYTMPPKLPTRLIDIGETDSQSSIRLLVSPEKAYKYAALSHCWGQILPIKTTKATLSKYTDKIELSELPKTFQETIDIVRRLGIRYLWIDTLCIVQDDKEDWERESAQMCQIYQNGFLTIAASAAENCHGGLIQPFVRSCLGTYGDSGKLVTSVRFGHWNSVQRHSPLESRAWALQEDLLSRRIVCFAQPQLFWRCNETMRSEDGLLDDIEWEDTFMARMRKSFVNIDTGNLNAVYESWRELAITYSARSLTFETDKLPALAGITQYYQELLRDEPMLGLWKRDLVAGLLWMVDYERSEAIKSVHGIPSWSWLSITGHISYKPIWDFGFKLNGEYHADPKLEILSASLIWSGKPLSSLVQESKLLVRGCFLLANSTVDFSYVSPHISLWRNEGDDQQTVLGEGMADLAFEHAPPTTWCLHLATITSQDLDKNRSQHGRFVVMMLQPLAHFPATYRRIGLAVLSPGTEEGSEIIPFMQCFREAEECTISLV